MKKVLVAGPCYIDTKSLKRFLESTFSAKSTETTQLEKALELLEKENFDLIMVSRICAGDKKSGFELIDYLKKKHIKTPAIMLTRFEKSQKQAVEQGATAAFDMDLLIGFIRPSMEEKRKKALEILKKFLD
jgi:DNA-binding NtrC family response regulator